MSQYPETSPLHPESHSEEEEEEKVEQQVVFVFCNFFLKN